MSSTSPCIKTVIQILRDNPEIECGCTVQLVRSNPHFSCQCPSCEDLSSECNCIICKLDNTSNESFVTCDEVIETPQTTEKRQFGNISAVFNKLVTSWKFWCFLFIVCIIFIVIMKVNQPDSKYDTTTSTTIGTTKTTIGITTKTTKTTTKKPWNPI